eukprot:6204297-Pleurochrysis_carterae.AAC.4
MLTKYIFVIFEKLLAALTLSGACLCFETRRGNIDEARRRAVVQLRERHAAALRHAAGAVRSTQPLVAHSPTARA